MKRLLGNKTDQGMSQFRILLFSAVDFFNQGFCKDWAQDADHDLPVKLVNNKRQTIISLEAIKAST